MRNYLGEYVENIKLMDWVLKPANQGVLQPMVHVTPWGRFLQLCPIAYISFWIAFYTYLIFGQMAGLAIISQQLWCLMSVLQIAAKLVNGLVQRGKLEELLQWCEGIYTATYKEKYRSIVYGVFEKTNFFIKMCIRINTSLVFSAVTFYLTLPLVERNRATPTPVSIDGVILSQVSFKYFVLIYGGEFLHAFFVFLVISGFDAIFIQCIMSMTFRFRTMRELLNLLSDCSNLQPEEQKEILVDIYKMHLNVLDATELFRSYYFLYGLVQLGNNLLCNCSILYILQTIGYDIGSVTVLLTSSTQVFIACAFGQLLQDEAHEFDDALYNVDWLQMSLENKKNLIMLMTGSNRKVNIRAGGTYELNLALFAQIMKAGATLCAVMQAM